jgi:hypothetical protein
MKRDDISELIDSDCRPTVLEIAQNCGISKTMIHKNLSHDLNMSHSCVLWVFKILPNENLPKRVARILSRQFISKIMSRQLINKIN